MKKSSYANDPDAPKGPESTGACSRSRAATGSLLQDTEAEIQQLEETGDPIFKQAATELREAANYSFPANTKNRNTSDD